MAEYWAVQWHSKNNLDGDHRHFIFGSDRRPLLFDTRQEARKFIQKYYSYIRGRRDLRAEPHGWYVPEAVKVRLVLEEIKEISPKP